MKAINLFILLCLLVSCKGQPTADKNIKATEITQKESVVEISCDKKLVSLITTSLNFDNSFKESLLADVSNSEENIYLIELYVNDSGEDLKNTVGWVQLNLNNNILTDITEDIQEGKQLKYDKKLCDSYVSDCLREKSAQIFQ